MNQTELNFLQEALYAKCDTVLQTIADNANAQAKKLEKTTTTTKKGETK